MRVSRSADRVDRDLGIAIRAVLEPDRAGKTGGKFPVHLALGRPGSDGAPAHEVRDVLRGDHIEILNRGWKPHFRDIENQAAGDSETVIDAVGAIKIRVIDKPLPANRGTGLLEVDAHQDFKIRREALPDFDKTRSVFARRFRIVDRAGAHDHEHPVIFPMNDAVTGVARELHRG